MKNLLSLFKREKKEYKFDNPCYLCDVSIMGISSGDIMKYIYYLSSKFDDFVLYDKRFIIYNPRGENKCIKEYFGDRYLCPALIEEEIIKIAKDIYIDLTNPYIDNEQFKNESINIDKLYNQYNTIRRRKEKLYKLK